MTESQGEEEGKSRQPESPLTVSAERVSLPISQELSTRESEIARLVARGLPNKSIAQVLDISPYTVATHLKRTYSKLGIRSRIELAVLVAVGGDKPLPGAPPRTSEND